MDEKALRLISEANAVLARGDRGASFHYDAQRKAVEISDFLGTYGEQLDANGQGWIVDRLGSAVDALASGAQATLDSAMESPWQAATDSLQHDAEELGNNLAKFGLPVAALVALLVIVIMIRR